MVRQIALALGAQFVFVGRPFNDAAAIAGQPGVERAITLLREGISRNRAVLGTHRRCELCPEHLRSVP